MSERLAGSFQRAVWSDDDIRSLLRPNARRETLRCPERGIQNALKRANVDIAGWGLPRVLNDGPYPDWRSRPDFQAVLAARRDVSPQTALFLVVSNIPLTVSKASGKPGGYSRAYSYEQSRARDNNIRPIYPIA